MPSSTGEGRGCVVSAPRRAFANAFAFAFALRGERFAARGEGERASVAFSSVAFERPTLPLRGEEALARSSVFERGEAPLALRAPEGEEGATGRGAEESSAMPEGLGLCLSPGEKKRRGKTR